MSETCSNSFDADYSTQSVSLREIEASIRLPMLHGLMACGVWLVVGTLFQLIATLQLVYPSWFADCSWFTHGKTAVAADTVLLYGFAIQLLTTLGLYLSCRLSRKNLRHSFTYLVAGKTWNLGVVIGVVGIFLGDATGYEFFALPAYASGILFVSFAVMTIKNLLVIHYRSERNFYPAQVFQAASLFWFLWVLATAIVVLQVKPVAGVAQFVVNKWYVNGVFQLVMGTGGIAVLFYFLPQITERPLYSRELAVTAFWTLLFVGGWTGLSGRWPLPAWISGVSSGAAFLLVVPLATLALNLWLTVAPEFSRVWRNTSGRFMLVGSVSYVLWLGSEVMLGFTGANELFRTTHFESAREILFIYGFVGMTGVGAICLILPRLTGVECDCKGSSMIFNLGVAGSLIAVTGFALAGLKQGIALADSSAGFGAISKSGLGLLQFGMIGEAILLVAAVMLLCGMGSLVARSFYAEFPVLEWVEEEVKQGIDKEVA